MSDTRARTTRNAHSSRIGIALEQVLFWNVRFVFLQYLSLGLVITDILIRWFHYGCASRRTVHLDSDGALGIGHLMFRSNKR